MRSTFLPILMFHDLGQRTSAICMRQAVFRRGLARLAGMGYCTLSLRQAAAKLLRGDPLPRRALAITFDDGFQTVYGTAFDILQQHRMTATVFLTVGRGCRTESSNRLPRLCGRSMLSWGEIRQMHQAGIHFGAHTLTHPDVTRLSPERLLQEICESKAVIEDALGSAVDTFSYPYGRYDRRSLAVVHEHFTCACSDRLGLVTPDSNLHALERVDGYYLHSDLLFGLMGRSIFPWYVRARAIPRQLRRALVDHP